MIQNNKPAVSTNINPRLVDPHWFNTFKVIKNISRETFSEVFLIKMISPISVSGQERALRKIRKVIFNDSNSKIEDFRFSLEDFL